MPNQELALSAQAIVQHLAEIPTWKQVDGKIEREIEFKDFIEAMEFVNKLAGLAEEQQHHPEIRINYNQVKLILSTHDVDGLSQKDFTLASKVDQLV